LANQPNIPRKKSARTGNARATGPSLPPNRFQTAVSASLQRKPVIAAPSVYRPTAAGVTPPAVYRQNAAPLVQQKPKVAAPPVYRPATAGLAAPAVYRPDPTAPVQRSPNLPVRPAAQSRTVNRQVVQSRKAPSTNLSGPVAAEHPAPLPTMVRISSRTAVPQAIQLLAKLPVSTYVEVRAPGHSWYGYISEVHDTSYEVVMGGTSKGYGIPDRDAKKFTVPRESVFLHPMVKVGLKIAEKDDRELDEGKLLILKGRSYHRMASASVASNWTNISQDERRNWDDTYRAHYKANLEIDEMAELEYGAGRHKTVGYLKRLNALRRVDNSEIALGKFFEEHKGFLAECGVTDKSEWVRVQRSEPIPLTDDPIYDADVSFKIGWKGKAIVNTHRRQRGQAHGEYTGRMNLAKGVVVAEGSYRLSDDLNQNEIVYQLWRTAHLQNGLDMDDPAQRKPLRTLIRNHVVNEAAQKILGAIPKGKYSPGTDDYAKLLNIPNIRSAVFLVKDRGRELGITGIREVEIKGVDAIISFR
jgi:hypothetical protein